MLQEIRRIRLEEPYRGWQSRRLTQEEAARLLGGCERMFRRYVDRYEDEGLDGLADKRLGQVSARRAPVDEVVCTETLYRERYQGWNVKHFHSFYRREHGGEGLPSFPEFEWALERRRGGAEMPTLMDARAMEWKARVMEQGIAQGRAEGRRELLCRQAERRFGPEMAERLAGYIAGASGVEELSRWVAGPWTAAPVAGCSTGSADRVIGSGLSTARTRSAPPPWTVPRPPCLGAHHLTAHGWERRTCTPSPSAVADFGNANCPVSSGSP